MKGMEWGTVPAWAAVAVAIVAASFSYFSWRASKRSADTAIKSASTAAAALEFQVEQAKPKVELVIEVAGRHVYRLFNKGGMPAVGIALTPEDEGRVQWEDPLGSALEARQACQFLVTSMANVPTTLHFTWDGQEQAVHVPMP
jgi:hypothetical protein